MNPFNCSCSAIRRPFKLKPTRDNQSLASHENFRSKLGELGDVIDTFFTSLQVLPARCDYNVPFETD